MNRINIIIVTLLAFTFFGCEDVTVENEDVGEDSYIIDAEDTEEIDPWTVPPLSERDSEIVVLWDEDFSERCDVTIFLSRYRVVWVDLGPEYSYYDGRHEPQEIFCPEESVCFSGSSVIPIKSDDDSRYNDLGTYVSLSVFCTEGQYTARNEDDDGRGVSIELDPGESVTIDFRGQLFMFP